MANSYKTVLVEATDNFTRPANTTAYTANDLIANSTTAASVTPLQFNFGGSNGIGIKQVRVHKDDDDLTAATFDIHFWDADPTTTAPAVGDNGTIVAAVASAQAGNYLGSVTVDFTSGFEDLHVDENAQTATATIYTDQNIVYALIGAGGGYTPASAEVFTVDVLAEVY